jgi:quinol monooxygenase YgiN
VADHITFFRMKALPGKRQAVIDHFHEDEETTRSAKGFVRAILVLSNEDPDALMAGVRFDSAESYNANSNDPETNSWYEGLRAMLAADPEWFNGTLAMELNR